MAHKRNYLIFEDVRRDRSLRPVFDACIVAISGNNIHVSKTRAEKGYPSYPCFRVNGSEILTDAALKYYLSELGKTGFNFEQARDFTEIMRKLCGWQWDVDRTLRNWVEDVIRDPFFYDVKQEDTFYPEWKLRPGEPSYQLPEDYFRFASYIAVGHVKYGASYGKSTANEIFSFISTLGSDLPEKLKKHGSGDLPKEVMEYKDSAVSCKANDAFAIIKIALKEETEESYRKVFDFLCKLLKIGFPHSYSIDFRSSTKNLLPIKRLPAKGVHHLFANAIQYPALHECIEHYARLAMKEFEWYDSLQDRYCAMPGTFAVFALGIYNESYHTLVCDYLKMCDGEHQSIHGEFVLAYIEKYGFTKKGIEIYDLCEMNIQHLPKKLIALRRKL